MGGAAKLRIGVIGAGNFVAVRHAPSLAKNERATLTALCRRDHRKLQLLQKKYRVSHGYTDWRQMLDECELDAVLVATPHNLHAEPTIAALERGLHVLVEKPLANQGVDAQAMCAAAEAADRVLMVAYNNRFHSGWRAAKAAIDAGELGTIRQVSQTVSMYRREVWEEKRVPDFAVEHLRRDSGMPEEFFDWDLSANWISDRIANGGGTFNNAGSHNTDLALWLAGAAPTQVMAVTDRLDREVEYFISVLARLDNDVQLSMVFADAIPDGNVDRLVVIGDLGFLDSSGSADIRIHAKGHTRAIDGHGHDPSPVDRFVESVLDGAPNPSPGREAANTVFLTQAAYESAREARVVAVAPPHREIAE